MCVQNMRTGLKTIQHSNNLDIVTVIVLCYNNQDKIYRTLDSIFEQKNVLIDLIISDDASGNFDEERVRKYIYNKSSININKFFININKYNVGTVRHANLIAKMLDNEFIKFVACCDTFYDEESLYKLVTFAKKYDRPVVSSISEVCGEDTGSHLYYFPQRYRVNKILKLSQKQMFKQLCMANIISSAGTLFRKSFFKDGFDESYRYLEDYPTWLKFYRNNIDIPYMDCVTAKYFIGGNSSANGTAYDSALLKRDMLQCYEKEILPYINMINIFSRQIIYYRYNFLNGKVKIRHMHIHIYICFKKYIKLMLSRIKNKCKYNG